MTTRNLLLETLLGMYAIAFGGFNFGDEYMNRFYMHNQFEVFLIMTLAAGCMMVGMALLAKQMAPVWRGEVEPDD